MELFPNYLALKAHIGFLPCVVYGSLTFDATRSGAPGKLSNYMTTIEAWAKISPLSASDIHQRLVEEFDVKVHLNTVKMLSNI